MMHQVVSMYLLNGLFSFVCCCLLPGCDGVGGYYGMGQDLAASDG